MANTVKLPQQEDTAPLQLAADDLCGKEVGGYVIEEPLGEGGMGLVYRARHPILNRHFAVKVLRPEAAADPRISLNFEREAQTLSSLKHPHIIDIVGFGTLEDGRQYMVMEFVKGQTLDQELVTGRLGLERALKLADQILDGLDAAHSVGVIHRDMKPSNVLIARVSGGSEVLKLLDFGLAKLQPESLVGRLVDTAAGASAIAGTPEYIAPEQAQGKHAGKHSDLYSFGVVFFEMLTGFRPFMPDELDPDRVRSLLKGHIHEPAPLISSLAAPGYFPVELEDLVADLLKKDPNERPSSAGTVRARLAKVQRLLQRPSTAMFTSPPAAAPLVASQVLVAAPPSRVWMVAVAALGVLVGLGGWWFTRAPAEIAGVTPPPASSTSDENDLVALPQGRKAPTELEELVLTFGPAVAVPGPFEATSSMTFGAAVIVPSPSLPPAPILAAAPLFPSSAPTAGPSQKKAPPRLTVSIAATPTAEPQVQINKSGCEPNDRWRASAKANLQEIQQYAAGDKKTWAHFENVEPSIMSAIASASTGVECDIVETRIEQLARKSKP